MFLSGKVLFFAALFMLAIPSFYVIWFYRKNLESKKLFHISAPRQNHSISSTINKGSESEHLNRTIKAYNVTHGVERIPARYNNSFKLDGESEIFNGCFGRLVEITQSCSNPITHPIGLLGPTAGLCADLENMITQLIEAVISNKRAIFRSIQPASSAPSSTAWSFVPLSHR